MASSSTGRTSTFLVEKEGSTPSGAVVKHKNGAYALSSEGVDPYCDGYHLTGEEVALLVALYDHMGSGRLSFLSFHDDLVDDVLSKAFDSLEAKELVEGTPAIGAHAVDISLTDVGMEVANVVQDGFPRGAVPKLEGFKALPPQAPRRLPGVGKYGEPIRAERVVVTHERQQERVYGAAMPTDPDVLPGRLLFVERYDPPIPAKEWKSEEPRTVTLVAEPEVQPVRSDSPARAGIGQKIMATGLALLRWFADSCR